MFTTDLIRTYLLEIGRYPLLNKEEEVSYAQEVKAMTEIETEERAIALKLRRKPSTSELAILLNKSEPEIRRILHRGKRAKDKLTVANLRLVVAIAKKYQNRNVEFLDLIQEGTLGLSRSIEKFDPAKGYKLSTYAYWWITQAITRAIAEHGRTIRLPINLTEKINKLKKVRRELAQKLGRYPTVEEMAIAANFNVEKTKEWLKLSLSLVSLDMKVGKGEDSRLIEFMESGQMPIEEQVDNELLEENIQKMLSTLTDKQKTALTLRYGIASGEEQTLDQVGEVMGCSRERVRQLQMEGIKAIRRRHQDIRN